MVLFFLLVAKSNLIFTVYNWTAVYAQEACNGISFSFNNMNATIFKCANKVSALTKFIV